MYGILDFVYVEIQLLTIWEMRLQVIVWNYRMTIMLM